MEDMKKGGEEKGGEVCDGSNLVHSRRSKIMLGVVKVMHTKIIQEKTYNHVKKNHQKL
jgi:hypothetical protein